MSTEKPDPSGEEEIAGWGTAVLIKLLDGRFELRGVSPEDRKAAQEC